MKRKEIASGTKFGRWTVIDFAFAVKTPLVKPRTVVAFWNCVCSCGQRRPVSGCSLRAGTSVSCGCLGVELSRTRFITHGETARRETSPEFYCWCRIRQRCHNPRNRDYEYYGSRGISVCERWNLSFNDFLRNIGRRPGQEYSIDRINNNGNYEPGNVRWATRKEQANNRRRRAA